MSKLQETFALQAASLINKAFQLGYTVTLGEAWRTPQQAQWDADHGSGISHSLHTERLAIDLNFFKDGALITDGSKLKDIGDWWKSLGATYRWGGDFKTLPDGNHFSITPDGVRA
jgi:hypothetical protein